MDSSKRLGEHLVDLGYATPVQIEEALILQGRMRGDPERGVKPSPGRARILVTEDDPALRGLLANLLVMRGYTVREAQDGEEAAALLGQETFDCLVTDWDMPGKNGLELARAAKVLNPLMPVILASGSLDPGTMERYTREGLIDGYLPKPFHGKAIYQAVERALGTQT